MASTTPNLVTYQDPADYTPSVALHEVVSFIRPPEDTVNYYNSQVEVPYGVYYVGCEFTTDQTSLVYLGGQGGVVACSFGANTAYLKGGSYCTLVTSAGVHVVSEGVFSTSLVGAFAYVYVGPRARVHIAQAVITQNSPGTTSPIHVVNNSEARVEACDISGTSTIVAIRVESGSYFTQVYDIRLTTSTRTRFLTLDNSRYERTSGSAIGATNGNCVVLTNGALTTGLETAASGNLTNGATPGNEIVVGGNAVTTFAALPTTDLAAATPQLCRAT
jgi:hypothetical protein